MISAITGCRKASKVPAWGMPAGVAISAKSAFLGPMSPVYVALLIVHIAAAAMLFGGGIGMLPNLRKTLEIGKEAFAQGAADAAKRGGIMGIASVVTLVSGLGLIFTIGGFKAVPFTIHIALTLMIGAFVVSFAIMKPQTAKLVELSQAEAVDKDAATKSIKKMAMGVGILHLVWITNLVLMIIK